MKPEIRSIVSKLYPSDTLDRASSLLVDMGGSSGAYSHSQGIPAVRKRVAEMIYGSLNYLKGVERDGYPADPNDIFLTAGYIDFLYAVERVQQCSMYYKR